MYTILTIDIINIVYFCSQYTIFCRTVIKHAVENKIRVTDVCDLNFEKKPSNASFF